MKIDFETAVKPLRKLRKLLVNFPAHPNPEDVHDLRTQTRRLEAALHALPLGPPSRNVLRLMRPVRKAAGAVRDLDVLIARAASLAPHAEQDGLIRLLEHMVKQRAVNARRLRSQLLRHQAKRKRSLKHCLKQINKLRFETAGERPLSAAPAQMLSAKLDHWPQLHQDNLHEYRKTLKKVRYVLQISCQPDEKKMQMLEKVNDAIGDWHDWMELDALATRVLNPETDAALLNRIRKVLHDKLGKAMAEAAALRRCRVAQPLAA